MALKQREPPLFRLPPEIRNQIYSYVFPSSFITPAEFFLTPEHLMPSLLSVSQRIRAEAAGPFYSSTTFKLHSHRLCVDWLCSLPPEHRNVIGDIRFDASETCEDSTCWRAAFQDLPGQDAERKLTALKHDLAAKDVLLDEGVLKTNVTINGRAVWTSEPMATAIEASRDGAYLGLVMFV